MQQQRPPEQAELTLRPARGFARLAVFLGGLLGFLALLGALINQEESPDWGVFVWLSVAIGLPAGLLWLFWRRARIVADENGLRWRRMRGPWQSARWDEVSDYFLTADAIAVVRFDDGYTLQIGGEWPEREQLKAHIAERATAARVQGWLVRSLSAGTVTGTHTFTYSEQGPRKRWLTAHIGATLLAVMAVGTLFLMRFVAQQKGDALVTEALVLLLLLPLCFLAMAIWIFGDTHRVVKDLKARLARGERIEADEQAVTFWSKGEPHRVAWSALTVGQQPFTYTSALSDRLLFEAMRAQYAPQLQGERPRRKRQNGALRSTEWSEGKRTFHYQTRTNREHLGILALIPLSCGLAAGLFFLTWYHSDLPWATLPAWILWFLGLLLGATVLPWALALWRYKRTRLVLDRESVTLGKQRVFFNEIARVGRDDALVPHYIETHEGRRPIRWTDALADQDGLVAEIERRRGV